MRQRVEWIASFLMAIAGFNAAVTIDWSNLAIFKAAFVGFVIMFLPAKYERYRLTRLIERQSAQLEKAGVPIPTPTEVMPKWAAYGARLLAVFAGLLFVWLMTRR